MKKSDLTGCRFGKLLALKECDERKYYGKTPIIMWECKCDCGNYITVASRNLNASLNIKKEGLRLLTTV